MYSAKKQVLKKFGQHSKMRLPRPLSHQPPKKPAPIDTWNAIWQFQCCILWQTHRVRGRWSTKSAWICIYPFRFLEDSSRAMLRAATTRTTIVYYMRVNQNSDKRISHFPRRPTKHSHSQSNTFTIAKWNCSFPNFGIGVSTFCVYLFKCYFVLLSGHACAYVSVPA